MKKRLILITRSYKYGGYCVAGFDAETKGWIRLVSSADPSSSEIPKGIFDRFGDLDILEVETRGEGVCGCQSENYILDLSVPPVRRGRLTFYELLNAPYLSKTPYIFGNSLSALTEREIYRERSSLGLFLVNSLRFNYYLGDDGKPHYRSEFVYRGMTYTGISVTDPVYRRDEFTGQTIEHALVAVSLPAVPYPNGKYYKFIAKIFPLTADEADRTEHAPAVSAAPALFSRDRPTASEESAVRAVRFLRALSEGRDPDTDAPLDPKSILSPAYAAWLQYCASLIGRGRKPMGELFDETKVYLLRDRIGEIELSDTPLMATKLCERINAVREPYGKKLTAIAVGVFFTEVGLLETVGEEKKRKFPTDLGRKYGIKTEMRVNMHGISYPATVYGREAQQFLLDNIEQVVCVLDSPL